MNPLAELTQLSVKPTKLAEQKLFFIEDTGNLVEPALSAGNAGDLEDHYSPQEMAISWNHYFLEETMDISRNRHFSQEMEIWRKHFSVINVENLMELQSFAGNPGVLAKNMLVSMKCTAFTKQDRIPRNCPDAEKLLRTAISGPNSTRKLSRSP